MATSGAWSCGTLLAGLDHVEKATKAELMDVQTLEARVQELEMLLGKAKPVEEMVDHEDEAAAEDPYNVPEQADDGETALDTYAKSLQFALGSVLQDDGDEDMIQQGTPSQGDVAQESVGTPDSPSSTTASTPKPKESAQDGKGKATRKVLLANAAKAQLRRMVTPHKTRTDLECDDHIKQEWNKGTKSRNQMAQLLQDCNWDKEEFSCQLLKIVESRCEYTIKKDQGWYSEKEMRDDLKWSTQKVQGAIRECQKDPESFIRNNLYDGATEYWITVRQTGSRTETHTEKEVRTQREKLASGSVEVAGASSLGGVRAMMDANAKQVKGVPDKNQTGAQEQSQHKEIVKKFAEFMLAKITKTRSLSNELSRNFEQDEKCKGSIATLEADVKTLEAEYDKMQEVLGSGEVDGFDTKWWANAQAKMKAATVKSSRAVANELKVKQRPSPKPEPVATLDDKGLDQ